MSDDSTTRRNDDSGTSFTKSPDPIVTTSLTSTIGRPPRRVYFWIQLFVVVAMMSLCVLSKHYPADVERADLKEWKRVTTLMMRVGEMLTTPIGFGCAVSIVIGLGLLAVRGMLDGILKFLIWLNVLWLIAFILFHTMAIWLPLIRGKGVAPA